jgi:hypothetical protein
MVTRQRTRGTGLPMPARILAAEEMHRHAVVLTRWWRIARRMIGIARDTPCLLPAIERRTDSSPAPPRRRSAAMAAWSPRPSLISADALATTRRAIRANGVDGDIAPLTPCTTLRFFLPAPWARVFATPHNRPKSNAADDDSAFGNTLVFLPISNPVLICQQERKRFSVQNAHALLRCRARQSPIVLFDQASGSSRA